MNLIFLSQEVMFIDVLRVKQRFGQIASGLSQVSGVELLDSRILMGLTDWVGCIYIVEHLCAQAADIRGVAYVSGLLGLTAGRYASRRGIP